MDAYTAALAVGDPGVDLVTVGAGEITVPPALEGRLHDLGFLPTEERDSALAGALALAQPSLMESFSRSVMEAWLVGTPVLVRDGSEVVSWHCERSGGGRVFADGDALAAALRALVDDPGLGAAMGASGRQYVLDNYQWPVVLDRMEASLTELMASAGTPDPAN